MRHRVQGKKLNRSKAHRRALQRNLVRSLFKEFTGRGFIVTTRSKAKFVQPRVEKMISLGRKKTLHNIRQAMSYLQDRALVSTLFDQIGPYYANRPGGYTRVLHMAKPRLGDNAPRSYLGFVRDEAQEAATAE